MGNIKKISLLFIVLSLGFQAHAQRCGACIIQGDIVTSFEDSFEKRYEMNSVMKFPQAIYVAHYLDSCGISLDQRVTVKKQDLDQNTWSPMLKMTDEAGEDTKIIAVPHSKLTKLYENIKDVEDLPELLKGQIKHFFEHYKELEAGKWVRVDGWENKAAAIKEIEASIKRYKEQK